MIFSANRVHGDVGVVADFADVGSIVAAQHDRVATAGLSVEPVDLPCPSTWLAAPMSPEQRRSPTPVDDRNDTDPSFLAGEALPSIYCQVDRDGDFNLITPPSQAAAKE